MKTWRAALSKHPRSAVTNSGTNSDLLRRLYTTTNPRLLPPHDLDAEEAVIGSLVIDGAAIEKVRYSLKPEHFYYAINEMMYSACLNLAQRHHALDQITISEELSRLGQLELCGGAANLSRLISICPTALDIETYAEVVQRLSTMRQIISAGESIAAIGYDGHEDGNKALAEASKVLDECRKTNTSISEVITPMQVGQDIIDFVGSLNDRAGVMTYGFSTLDKATTGLYMGEFVIVGGRPGYGKTQLMADCSENVAVARPDAVQLFVSAEMNMRMIEERRVARALNISVRDLRMHGFTETLDGSLMKYGAQVSEGHIYYLPRGTSSVNIIQVAHKLKETKGLDIIWIDYLQRLKDSYPEHKNETRDQAIGRVCSNLKQLAEDLQLPVVMASQLSRAVEHRQEDDKVPQLSDLRDSGNIEQDADTVLLLHRRMVAEPQTLYIAVSKHRQVGTLAAPVTLTWDYKTQRYTEGK